MKLICPPEAWQTAREINEAELNLTKFIAKQLNLPLKVDDATNKAYLGQSKANNGQSTVANDQNKVTKENDNTVYFKMKLPKSPSSQIIDGLITLNGHCYKACSGCVAGQVFGSYWVTAQSPIPPNSETGLEYKVDLRWSYSDLLGISGRYYHILPDPIYSKDGKRCRTEIGLHQDNGAPGTSGCIGVVGEDWSRLCNLLDELAKFNRYLRLVVEYEAR